MKKLITVCSALALAACGGVAGDADKTGADQAEMEEAPTEVVTAADGNPPAGRYRAVDEDGVVLIEELRDDGTYTFSDEAGEVLEEGSYVQKSPEELCFTANTESASEKCYSEQIGEDRVWRSTDPDTGVVATIERLDQ